MIVNLKRLAAATGQDWDEQIKRVIGFANLARLTIFFRAHGFTPYRKPIWAKGTFHNCPIN